MLNRSDQARIQPLIKSNEPKGEDRFGGDVNIAYYGLTVLITRFGSVVATLNPPI